MAYATFDDVFKRYPPIATMIGSAENEIASLDVASIYVYGAEGLVNGYVGAKYTTPLAGSDPLVTMVTVDIALYKMMEDKLPRIPEFADKRYASAIEILEKVRDGKMVLGSGQTTLTSGDQEAWSSVGSFHPTFSPVLDPLDQRVDENYVAADQSIRSGDVD